jgi:hypothetical protein
MFGMLGFATILGTLRDTLPYFELLTLASLPVGAWIAFVIRKRL